jgi:hypothetical protein
MPENWMDYKVGQEVYAVFWYSRNSSSATTKIASVGRKYARLEGIRPEWTIEIGTDEVKEKGYGKVATLYESEAAYLEMQEMRKLRESMRSIEWRNYSDEQVKAIAEILGVEP